MWSLEKAIKRGAIIFSDWSFHVVLEESELEMVTAVGQVSSYNKGYEIQRYLLLGDRRGGVSIYVIPAPSFLPRAEYR